MTYTTSNGETVEVLQWDEIAGDGGYKKFGDAFVHYNGFGGWTGSVGCACEPAMGQSLVFLTDLKRGSIYGAKDAMRLVEKCWSDWAEFYARHRSDDPPARRCFAVLRRGDGSLKSAPRHEGYVRMDGLTDAQLEAVGEVSWKYWLRRDEELGS